MKAQFKYAFLAGLYFRGAAFAVIFVMDVVFIILGSLGLLPFAAHVTAVSLGGVAIAVMLAANIGGDVAIARRMFSSPEAYLHMLTPVPRSKLLFASIAAMAVLDIFTMAFVIFAEVCLSFNLAGKGIWQIVFSTLRTHESYLIYVFWFILLMIAVYLLVIMIIMFSVTAKKSILFKVTASGLLSFLLACGCLYVASLLQLVLAPFGFVQRYGIFIVITLGSGAGLPVLLLLTLLEAAALYVLTAKLLERKVNL